MRLLPASSKSGAPQASRRDVLRAAAIALGVPALLRSPRALSQVAEPSIRTEQLARGVYLLDVGGTNVVASTGAGGTILVDGASAANSAALLRSVGALPDAASVHTLFNTHWHREQTGSNERLRSEGATVIAHENTRLWLTAEVVWPWDGTRFEPLPEAALPNRTFFYDGGEVALGSRSVEYGYLRHAAHTDGDIFVYFRDVNVIAVGDSVTGQGWQTMDYWTGGWIGGVVGNLELLLSLTNAETRIVPARGPVLTRADIEEQYAMYDTLCERIFRALYTGLSPDEAVDAKLAAEYEGKLGNSDEFVRRAFESTWAYLSPDA